MLQYGLATGSNDAGGLIPGLEIFPVKKTILLAAALLLLSPHAHAQNRGVFLGEAAPVAVIPAGVPLGFVQIAVSSSAVALTVPSGATYALVEATGASVLWRDDGQNPTTTTGMTIVAGQAPIAMANLQALKFIAASGSAQLAVSFYK
jgi:hypothetical protein